MNNIGRSEFYRTVGTIEGREKEGLATVGMLTGTMTVTLFIRSYALHGLVSA